MFISFVKTVKQNLALSNWKQNSGDNEDIDYYCMKCLPDISKLD